MAADPGFGPSAESVVVEGWEGGRVYELRSDGAQGQWATVLAWEPPRWLLLAWKPNTEDRPPTEVEVTFEELGGLTRVVWVHRGWERLGLLAEEARAGYGAGWQQQLRRYASAVEAAHRPHAN